MEASTGLQAQSAESARTSTPDRAFIRPIPTARLVSYPAGLTVGYFLNRYFTFHHVDNVRHVLDELARFFAVHAVGGLLKFGVFSLVVYAGEGADVAPRWEAAIPLIGVCLGGVVGMCFNFFVSRELVFDG